MVLKGGGDDVALALPALTSAAGAGWPGLSASPTEVKAVSAFAPRQDATLVRQPPVAGGPLAHTVQAGGIAVKRIIIGLHIAESPFCSWQLLALSRTYVLPKRPPVRLSFFFFFNSYWFNMIILETALFVKRKTRTSVKIYSTSVILPSWGARSCKVLRSRKSLIVSLNSRPEAPGR